MRGTMVLLIFLTVGAAPAAADLIYYALGVYQGLPTGQEPTGLSTLYSINAQTGAATAINTIHNLSGTPVLSMMAMAMDPATNQLYGLATASGAGPSLYTISPSGIATLVGPSGLGAGNSPSITFGSGPNPTAYAVVGVPASGHTNFNLYTINTSTGAFTPGNNPAQQTLTTSNGGNALANNPGTSNFYFLSGNTTSLGTPATNLYYPITLGTSTTSNTPSQTLTYPSITPGDLNYDPNFAAWLAEDGGIQSPGLRIASIFLSPDGSTLYGELLNGSPNSDNLESALVSISLDPTVTFIGQISAPGDEIIAGLSPSQVPEPGSLALLTAAAAGALGYTWRRRRATLQQPLSA